MKKLLAIFLVLALSLAVLAGCNNTTTDQTPSGNSGGDNSTDVVSVRLGGMTGPTSIGMAKLLSDDAAGTAKNDYEFVLVSGPDEILAKFLSGDLDVAAVPANFASQLYKKTGGEIQVVAVNTLGVVSLLEKGNTINSLADLAGKTVYMPNTARGSIPEIVFTYLLAQNDLVLGEDVMVVGEDPTNLAALLAEGNLVLSPEPAATAYLSQAQGSRRAIVFDDEWKTLKNGSEYITGVTVVRTEFAKENPKAIADFLAEYEASIAYANENPADTAAKVVEFKILGQKAPLIEKAIPNCHISFLSGAEMKAALSKYYSLLLPVKPQAFGGEAPADAFYYVK